LVSLVARWLSVESAEPAPPVCRPPAVRLIVNKFKSLPSAQSQSKGERERKRESERQREKRESQSRARASDAVVRGNPGRSLLSLCCCCWCPVSSPPLAAVSSHARSLARRLPVGHLQVSIPFSCSPAASCLVDLDPSRAPRFVSSPVQPHTDQVALVHFR